MSSLVCWSGGLDSTAALLHSAADSSHQVPVSAVSFNHRQFGSPRERGARAHILRWMKRQGYRVWHSEVEIVSMGVPIEPDAEKEKKNAHFERPSILHATYLGLAFPYLRRDDDLVFGYIKYDPAWHQMSRIREAHRALCDAVGYRGRLLTPLEWWDKQDVMENLEKWKFPLDLCWSCQAPKGRRSCGECDSCTERREAETALASKAKKGGVRV